MNLERSYKYIDERKGNRHYRRKFAKLGVFGVQCTCENPIPTGMWSVHDNHSWAECKCGGEYKTDLFRNVIG